MITDVAITLNWKGVQKSFEALSVCSIVKGKNNLHRCETVQTKKSLFYHNVSKALTYEFTFFPD
jgi:hypothetical protein